MKNTLKKISKKRVNNTTSNTTSNTMNKTMNKKIKKCKKTYCNKTVKKIEELGKKRAKIIAIDNETAYYPNKSMLGTLTDICYEEYCNPTCKNTFYESGKLSNKYKLLIKSSEKVSPGKMNSIIKQRKKIFGNKTTVLKNGFYEKIPDNIVEKARKKGIISGCMSTII